MRSGRDRLQRDRHLFLEQVLERRSRIVGPEIGWRRRFLFARDANLVQSAVIARVFLGDAFFDRLHALETASGIKVGALLA